jgi:hypothetical protein
LRISQPVVVLSGALERWSEGAFLADELFDPDGLALEAAAARWRAVGRADRADFLSSLVEEVRQRGANTA